MKLGVRQVYAVAGGLLLGLGLTQVSVYDGAGGAAILSGLGVGLMVLALVRE